MKLNQEGKQNIRKYIEKQLQKVPKYKKIKFEDSKLLEELIFDTITSSDQKTIAKIPVWTGLFLSKIDLSSISFNNVIWNLEPSHLLNIFDLSPKDKEKYPDYLSIDLSNTNAQIDFSQSFEILKFGKQHKLSIGKCNFNHVDLSNSHPELISYAEDSDFSYSNTNFQNNNATIFIECNLEALDLSQLFLSSNTLQGDKSEPLIFLACNLKNTKLHLIHPKNSPSTLNNILAAHIKEENLAGCYVNDKLIPDNKTSHKQAKQNHQAYNQYQKQLKRNIRKTISEQLTIIKKD